MPLSYWASIFCHTRPTFQVFTQDAGTASEQEARQGGPLLASSLRPPATCVNAYLVPCPPCGDFVGIRSYKQVRKETKTTTTMEKKKENLHWMGKMSEGGGVCCQKSWCSFWFSLCGLLRFINFIYFITITVIHCFISSYFEGKVCWRRKVQLSLTACIDK